MSPIALSAAAPPLEELASIRNGYTPRQLVTDPHGLYRGLQVRNLANDAEIDWGRLMSPRFDGDASRYQVSDGDLVVTLRGTPRAWQITAPPEGVLVVGQLAIVTPHTSVVDPGYLAWYFNHPATAAGLRALARGSSLQFVSMSELRAFRVPLPPLARQRAIGRVAVLARREQRLQQRLAEACRRLTDVQLLRVARTR